MRDRVDALKEMVDILAKEVKSKSTEYKFPTPTAVELPYYRRYSYREMLSIIMEIAIATFNDDEYKEFSEYLNQIFPIVCPAEGEFIAYKGAVSICKSIKCVVTLKIPEHAKRSSAFTNKCRCDEAIVLDIRDPLTNRPLKMAWSEYDNSFIYEKGKIVSVPSFDENRFNECSSGIHFFMKRYEALEYMCL